MGGRVGGEREGGRRGGERESGRKAKREGREKRKKDNHVSFRMCFLANSSNLHILQF